MKWPIFGSFNTFSLPNTTWFNWSFQQKYSFIEKHGVWKIFENVEIFKREIPKVYSFAPFLCPI